MLESKEAIIEDGLIGYMIESPPASPFEMRAGPVLLTVSPTKVSSQHKLGEAIAKSLLIGFRRFAGPAEAANRFLLRGRRMDFRQEPSAQAIAELARIASIGLDPIAWFRWD